MEQVLSRNKKVFLDVDSSGNILYLPLGQPDNGINPSSIIPPLKGTSAVGVDSPDNNAKSRSKSREGRR
jgi:hypothetical protein